MQWKPQHPAFAALIAAMLQETRPIYVVGGVVRDRLMGRAAKVTDLDLAVFENAIALSRRVADRLGWAFYAMDEGHDVARLVFTATGGEPLICDIASMRGHGLENDLRSRDFTINAMAFELHGDGRSELIDIVGGQADLAARVIRRVSPTSLVEDPMRLLRAVRLAAEFNMDIEAATRDQIERVADTIQLASPERLRDELWKMLQADGANAVELAEAVGLLRHVLPEVAAMMDVPQSPPHYLDVYDHTLLAMRVVTEIGAWLSAKPAPDEAETDWQRALQPWRTQLRRHFMQTMAGGHLRVDWLVWYAMLHDIGKPATLSEEEADPSDRSGGVRYRFFAHESVGATMAADRLTYLRFSRQEIALTTRVIEAHMRPHLLHDSFADGPISRRALYRFVRDVGGPADAPTAVDVALLALADIQATYPTEPPSWPRYLEHIAQIIGYAYDDHGQFDVRRRPLVDGHALMAHLAISPGPAVGRLLDALLEAQAAGDVETEEQALALAAALWQETDN